MDFKDYFVTRRVSLAGVDIGTSSVNVALLSQKGPEEPALEDWGSQRLPQGTLINGSIKKATQVVQAIKKITSVSKFRHCVAATALPSQSVLFKKILRPELPSEELRGFLHWEVSQHFCTDPEEIVFDYSELASPDDKTHPELVVVAAPRTSVAEFSTVIRSAGLQPTLIDSAILTLYNLYRHNYGEDRTRVEAILKIGEKTTYLTVVKGSSLVLSQVLTQGRQQFSEAIRRQTRLNASEVEYPPNRSKLSNSHEDGSPVPSKWPPLELEKTFLRLDPSQIETLYICGEGSLIPGLRQSLSRRLKLPVEFLNPLKGIVSNHTFSGNEGTRASWARYALSIGLALRMVQGR